jgi:hypothetical protein
MAAGATYEPIATQTLASAAASITFSSIPATYTDLKISFTGKHSTTGSGDNLVIRFNGDTAANYSRTLLQGDGSAASSSRSTAQEYAVIGYQIAGYNPSFCNVDIFNYAGSTFKTVLSQGSEVGTSGGSGQYGEVATLVNLWRSTAAITSIQILSRNFGTASFDIGTTATIYGIKAA